MSTSERRYSSIGTGSAHMSARMSKAIDGLARRRRRRAAGRRPSPGAAAARNSRSPARIALADQSRPVAWWRSRRRPPRRRISAPSGRRSGSASASISAVGVVGVQQPARSRCTISRRRRMSITRCSRVSLRIGRVVDRSAGPAATAAAARTSSLSAIAGPPPSRQSVRTSISAISPASVVQQPLAGADEGLGAGIGPVGGARQLFGVAAGGAVPA